MLIACLLLIPAAFVIAAIATFIARAVGRRLNALDGGGVTGQVKAAPRRVPNIGGVGIFAGVALPLLAGLLAITLMSGESLAAISADLAPFIPGLKQQARLGFVLLACLAVLHIMGLVDDRRPLGALPKLIVMLLVAGLGAYFTDSRLLTMLDAHAGGVWLSLAITVVWIGVVTNAFNFLDNMDGLSAGAAAICTACFVTVSVMSPQPQWFVAATLALLVGALGGFLLFNFPLRPRRKLADGSSVGGASIFMGDGGSLVVGFLIALMSVRVTYLWPATVDAAAAPWFTVFVPLVILAIPLYDFVSVCAIRISQGKSPFVGDLQHFSHRLVRHGLSTRSAVLVIYGCTAVTGIGAITLPRLQAWQAALVGVQTVLVLGVIALYEWKRRDDKEAA